METRLSNFHKMTMILLKTKFEVFSKLLKKLCKYLFMLWMALHLVRKNTQEETICLL